MLPLSRLGLWSSPSRLAVARSSLSRSSQPIPKRQTIQHHGFSFAGSRTFGSSRPFSIIRKPQTTQHPSLSFVSFRTFGSSRSPEQQRAELEALRASMRSPRSRRLFVWGTVGTCVLAFLSWRAALLGRSSEDPERRRRAEMSLKYLVSHFALTDENLREGRYLTLITSAFSHVQVTHLLFNMVAFVFAGNLGFKLGLGMHQMILLSWGSAVASSLGYIWEQRSRSHDQSSGKRAVAFGASGMVQGILTATALTVPRMQVSLMFIPVGLPYWAVVATYLLIDMDGLRRQRQGDNSGGLLGGNIAYAAHLSGAAFGALFYLVGMKFRFRP